MGIDLNKAIEGVDFDALELNLRTLLRLLLNKIEDLEKTVKDLRVENQTFGLRHPPRTFPQKQNGRI